MRKIIYIVAVPATVRSFLAERMHYLSDSYEVAAVCSPGAQHAQFKQEGLTVHAIPIERRISPLRDIVSLVRLVCLLKKEKPDVVHTMTPKAGLLGMIASWIVRVPVRIAMFNGELNLSNWAIRAIVRLTNAITCFFATHLNADGFGTRQYLMEQKVTKKPITVFWKGNVNGIDLVRFSPKGKRRVVREALGIDEATLVYIYVGRIVHDKGIDELVPAFIALLQQGLDIALVLVGGEEAHLDPIQEENRLAIAHTRGIYAAGQQSNIPDWLEAADIFVLPSHREGCNCSLLEAGAMGLPSIVSDIRGCCDVVQHGVNGFVVPAKDKTMLREAMLQLFESESVRQQLSAHSRPNVEKNFDRKDVWREMKNYYRWLISGTS